MRPVSRKEMESFLAAAPVVSSEMEQDEHEIRIVLRLGNQQSCVVRYDVAARKKEYLLSDPQR
ncbi:MAG TPA: hypothetical protein ENN17_13090 [bacterium]|nr:hypothetical protein [bacterium]